MHERLFRYYQRHRIVNINVNITVAGLLAIAIAKYPVLLTTRWIGEGNELLKTVAAAGIDGVADVIIYYCLHWVANHWRPLRPKHHSDRPENHARFFRNATVVQFERMALTPVYYGVAMGIMYVLMTWTNLEDSWAFVWGFVSGILTTRILHTSWGLWTGRFRPPPERMAPPEGAD